MLQVYEYAQTTFLRAYIQTHTYMCTHTYNNNLPHTRIQLLSTITTSQVGTLSEDTNTLQQTATHCNTLQHTATHRNILRHTVSNLHHHHLTSERVFRRLQQTATNCNILQHTATYCNTLQRTATYCNTQVGMLSEDTASVLDNLFADPTDEVRETRRNTHPYLLCVSLWTCVIFEWVCVCLRVRVRVCAHACTQITDTATHSSIPQHETKFP